MSRSNSKLLRNVIVCIVLIAPAASCLDRQRSAKPSSADFASRAKYLVKALNANLNPNLRVSLTDISRLGESNVINGFSLELYDGNDMAADSVDLPCPNPVFRAHFLFNSLSKERELVRFVSSGSATKASEDEFKLTLKNNPQWSKKEALGTAHLRFGPGSKPELLHQIPTQVLKSYIGEFKVTSANFVFDEIRRGPEVDLDLKWVVHVGIISSNRSEDSYTLVFEPFEGTLVSILKDP